MRRTGGLSSNQFVTNGILARLNVSLFSHYSSEKKVPGALESFRAREGLTCALKVSGLVGALWIKGRAAGCRGGAPPVTRLLTSMNSKKVFKILFLF